MADAANNVLRFGRKLKEAPNCIHVLFSVYYAAGSKLDFVKRLQLRQHRQLYCLLSLVLNERSHRHPQPS